jgi:hypothetical protein
MPSVIVELEGAWRIIVPKTCCLRHLSRHSRRCSVSADQVTLELSPREDGSYTQLSLSASLPTALPPRELRRLFAMLAFWSGWPVSVVLRVDATTAGWCEWWTDALCAVRVRDLEVRFVLSDAASPAGSRP